MQKKIKERAQRKNDMRRRRMVMMEGRWRMEAEASWRWCDSDSGSDRSGGDSVGVRAP